MKTLNHQLLIEATPPRIDTSLLAPPSLRQLQKSAVFPPEPIAPIGHLRSGTLRHDQSPGVRLEPAERPWPKADPTSSRGRQGTSSSRNEGTPHPSPFQTWPARSSIPSLHTLRDVRAEH